MKRGEIWLVNLDPTVGSEIRKSRPCVVVSPAELNDHIRTVIVAPMTSKGFAAAVDKVRLVKHLGAVNAQTLSAALITLQEVFTE